MAAALYDPQHGYYARQTRQVGRKGDFFTSVSVGPVFGALLAQRFLHWWSASGKPEAWRIIELGAHDGTLAADVLTALHGLDEDAFRTLDYTIIEPLPRLAAAQRDRLAEFGKTVTFTATAQLLEPRPGIAFGNELLDALPFHLVEWRAGRWTECRVGWTSGTFTWCPGNPLSPETAAATRQLSGPFPEGYRTEIRTCFPELFAPLAKALGTGLLLWLDYGFSRPDYYSVARSSGTLRTFSKHRAGEDPFADPGGCDITAHVDFTAAAEAGIALGMAATCFSDQGSWLTRLATPWLRTLEQRPDSSAIRQFQTLTHPSHLGARFHVLEMILGEDTDPAQISRTLTRLSLLENIRS